jgi:hypothetical protein
MEASRYNATLAERWPSGRRRLTRNQVWGNPTGVRIPLSPPLLECDHAITRRAIVRNACTAQVACDLHIRGRLRPHIGEPGSGGTASARHGSGSRLRGTKPCPGRSGKSVLQGLEGRNEEYRTDEPAVRTERWVGRYVLRSGGASLSVLADAAVHIRAGARRSLWHRVHLRRQAVVRLTSRIHAGRNGRRAGRAARHARNGARSSSAIGRSASTLRPS